MSYVWIFLSHFSDREQQRTKNANNRPQGGFPWGIALPPVGGQTNSHESSRLRRHEWLLRPQNWKPALNHYRILTEQIQMNDLVSQCQLCIIETPLPLSSGSSDEPTSLFLEDGGACPTQCWCQRTQQTFQSARQSFIANATNFIFRMESNPNQNAGPTLPHHDHTMLLQQLSLSQFCNSESFHHGFQWSR